VRLFVSIALTGEKGRQQSLLKAKEMKEKVEAKEAADITEDYSVVDIRDKSSLNVIIADEENWALEAEIAATVTELALDAASTVIEGKMRHNGGSYLKCHTVFFFLTFHIIAEAHVTVSCILFTVVVISSSLHLLPFQPPYKHAVQ
jgi:hypothetical protein